MGVAAYERYFLLWNHLSDLKKRMAFLKGRWGTRLEEEGKQMENHKRTEKQLKTP